MAVRASSGIPAVDAALDALWAQLRRVSPFKFVGRPVRITFTAAATKTEVLHDCAEIPDGFQVVRGNGAIVTDEPGLAWTPSLAYLRSTIATQVTGYFYKLLEDPHDVAST